MGARVRVPRGRINQPRQDDDVVVPISTALQSLRLLMCCRHVLQLTASLKSLTSTVTALTLAKRASSREGAVHFSIG